MKIEIRCPACGRGYLVDEAKIPASGGKASCQACGVSIELPSRVPPRPEVSTAEAAPRIPPATARPQAPALAVSPEMVCPRCGLHFTPGKSAPKPEGARPTVLVVEDMEYFREIAREALEPKYVVKVARNVTEARAALAAGGIDLLLLDLTLQGGENGRTLLAEWREKPCPVLIFTADDESEMYGQSWDQLRALGADDLVVKGMNAGESLVRKVDALLGG